MDIGGSPRRQDTMGVLLLRLALRECLKSLMNHLSQKVLDLEKAKDVQAVESSDDDLNEEDASKQGRNVTRQSQCYLEAEEESTMAFELIKFIKSILEE
ncbi:hypothetical protein Tco_1198464 [Tanacetum coccineum]